jgi:hypothetical protein
MSDFKKELQELTLQYAEILFEKMKNKCREKAKEGSKEFYFRYCDWEKLENLEKSIKTKFEILGIKCDDTSFGFGVKWMD